MEVTLQIRNGTFLNETLTWLGIVYPNNFVRIKQVDANGNFLEGLISDMDGIEHIRKHGITSDIAWIDLYKNPTWVKEQIAYMDSIKDNTIYLLNTEPFFKFNETNQVTGLASGNYTANVAYEAGASSIRFVDYSKKSLEFQQELIHSTNRKETFIKYFPCMITGNQKATLDDLEKIDFERIDNIYNNLKTKSVEFLYTDLSIETNLVNLFETAEKNSLVWLSNIFYYVSCAEKDKSKLYNIVRSYERDKKLDIIIQEEINYES